MSIVTIAFSVSVNAMVTMRSAFCVTDRPWTSGVANAAADASAADNAISFFMAFLPFR